MMEGVINLCLAVFNMTVTSTILWALASTATAGAWAPGWVQCFTIVICAKAILSNPDVPQGECDCKDCQEEAK